MSPRPKRHRKMGRPPFAKGFKPFGTRGESTPAVILLYEEYEAIKLADYDGLSQEEAAKSMDVSRPTFTRIYESARKKIAKGLAESSMIIIEGGNVSFEDHWFECENCGSTFRKPIKDKVIQCIVCGSSEIKLINEQFKKGQNQQRNRKPFGHGHGGFCVCPGCGSKEEHIPGIPCRTKVCSDCGISLVRENSEHHKIVISKKQKPKNMKVAIAAVKKDVQSEMDERFGRGAYFAIINTNTWETEFVDNPSKDAPSGAGVKAVEFIISKNIDKIIAREFGPKVKNLLEKAKIEYIETGKATGSILEIVKSFS